MVYFSVISPLIRPLLYVRLPAKWVVVLSPPSFHYPCFFVVFLFFSPVVRLRCAESAVAAVRL